MEARKILTTIYGSHAQRWAGFSGFSDFELLVSLSYLSFRNVLSSAHALELWLPLFKPFLPLIDEAKPSLAGIRSSSQTILRNRRYPYCHLNSWLTGVFDTHDYHHEGISVWPSPTKLIHCHLHMARHADKRHQPPRS